MDEEGVTNDNITATKRAEESQASARAEAADQRAKFCEEKLAVLKDKLATLSEEISSLESQNNELNEAQELPETIILNLENLNRRKWIEISRLPNPPPVSSCLPLSLLLSMYVAPALTRAGSTMPAQLIQDALMRLVELMDLLGMDQGLSTLLAEGGDAIKYFWEMDLQVWHSRFHVMSPASEWQWMFTGSRIASSSAAQLRAPRQRERRLSLLARRLRADVGP